MSFPNLCRCLIFLCVATVALESAENPALKAAQQAYHKAGTAVMEAVLSKKVDPVQVEAQVVEMERNAAILARAYAVKFPEGKKLIDTVIAQVGVLDATGEITALGPMKALPFKETEEQWHDGAYFKTHDLGVSFEEEQNEHFTDPIHTMVHPMMVLQAAIAYHKTKDAAELKAMKDEMEEGLEQAEKMLQTLSK